MDRAAVCVRDRVPLPGDLVTGQKNFKIVGRTEGKNANCTSRAPPLFGGAPPDRGAWSDPGENSGGFMPPGRASAARHTAHADAPTVRAPLRADCPGAT